MADGQYLWSDNGATGVPCEDGIRLQVRVIAHEGVRDDLLETGRRHQVMHVSGPQGKSIEMAEHLADRAMIGDGIGHRLDRDGAVTSVFPGDDDAAVVQLGMVSGCCTS